MDKVWRVRDKNKRKNTTKGKARVDKVEGEELLEAYWRLREEIGIKTYLHGLMDENAETAILCRGPGPAKNKLYRGIPVVRRRAKMHRCAIVGKETRVQLTS